MENIDVNIVVQTEVKITDDAKVALQEHAKRNVPLRSNSEKGLPSPSSSSDEEDMIRSMPTFTNEVIVIKPETFYENEEA